MTNIFTLGDMDDFSEEINLDELYEKKKQLDLSKLEIYNKILNRIHNKIKFISRQKQDQYIWFLVPEMMIGIPRYNNTECITYVIDKLKNNGFLVKYTHPNMLFISWQNWIPDYVRNEIKKKTNVAIDGYGNIVKKQEAIEDISNVTFDLGTKSKGNNKSKTKEEYKSINNYKPTGNSIYSDFLFKLNKD